MTVNPSPKKAVASLVSYRPALGKSANKDLIRLSANESALGWAPKVEEALRKMPFQLSRMGSQGELKHRQTSLHVTAKNKKSARGVF